MLTYSHILFTIRHTGKEKGGDMLQPQQNEERIDLSIPETRGQMALLVTRLFERWGLSTADQLNLLGLSETSRSLLGKYRRGEPLPQGRDIQDRVGWLMSIHKALRLLYPRDENLRYTWVNRRNQMLANLTPMEVMREQGLIGIAKIARYLDFLRGL
jgi:hypothetical protein